MKLTLERTPESKGLIYKASDPVGKPVLSAEREVHDFNIWTLHFRSDTRAAQAVMRQNTIETEFQMDGKQCGRIKEARFSVAGKIYVEDESGRRLGSVRSGLARVYFYDAAGRRVGVARHMSVKGKLGFLPSSQAHKFWNRDLEFDEASYDERFLYALICFLVTSEFASSSS